jgi:hypothetical protein
MKTLEWVYAMVDALIRSHGIDKADSRYHYGDLRGRERNTEFISNAVTFAFRVNYLRDPYI